MSFGDGYLWWRIDANGTYCAVIPLTFGRARLVRGPNEWEIEDGWLYEDPIAAVAAACEWDWVGDDPPFGWVRRFDRFGNTRRRVGGDPTLEYGDGEWPHPEGPPAPSGLHAR